MPGRPHVPRPRAIGRKRIHDILELCVSRDPLSELVNNGLVVLIFLNIVAFSSETGLTPQAGYGAYFNAFNVFSVADFILEYELCIWNCVEVLVSGGLAPWRARVRFAARPLPIVDPFAILLFYLSFLMQLDLRVLRILRIFRFLKSARYSPAMQSLGREISNERRALLDALLVMLSLMMFAATGIYHLERDAQPDVFGSISAAI